MSRLAISLFLLSVGPLPTIAQVAEQDQKILLNADTLICALDRAYGVFRGSSFSPDSDEHGFAAGPKVLTLPDRDDRLPQLQRGWVHWKEEATKETYFTSTMNAFNGTSLEWHLNYTYVPQSGEPVSVSLKRLCFELNEIVPQE